MKKIIFCFFVIVCFCLLSCDILRDEPFEISSWTPGEVEIDDIENINVSLYFSGEPNRFNTEKAFSLTENGDILKGNFIWGENSFSFVPLSPFCKNKDYIIRLTTEADDINGLSLENNFEGHFSTKLPSDHPFVNLIEPQNESVVIDVHQKIKIEFSDAITKTSLQNNVSFSPSINGTWQLNDEGKIALFYPKDNWKINETYIITISPYIENIYAKQMGKEIQSRIIIVDQDEYPQLLEVNILNVDYTEKYSLIPVAFDEKYIGETIYENENIESNDKIRLMFSVPVEVLKVKTFFQIEPSIKYKIENEPPYSNSIIISFEDKPAWNSSYILKMNSGLNDQNGNVTIKPYQYKIKTNGVYSKPPKLVGLRVPSSFIKANTEGFAKLTYRYDEIYSFLVIDSFNFPNSVGKPISFEFYFETALDAEINLFSAMELFSSESTNNSISFFPESINYKTDNLASEFADLKCLVVYGEIINTSYSGLFTMKIKSGLTDTNGNKNNEAMSIQLTK
ncbi:MAG: hypothetical protein Ta2B_05110 [Termitinemataceae bacterium]|nr:MAG: hypothetical protein Ta2B_05110 [Termitinemataceae bacterium]